MELVDLHSKSYAKHEEVRAECSEDRVFPALLAEIMKEDWLRRFYNSAVECMAAISGYSKSQIADATSGMFNSIIRLA